MREIGWTDYEVMPLGSYPAACKSAEFVEGQYGEQIEFKFELTGGEHDGRMLTAWASATFSQRSKLYRWARSVFGDGVTGSSWAPEQMVGMNLLLDVVIKRKDDGSEYNRVEELRAAPQPVMVAAGAADIPEPLPATKRKSPSSGRKAEGVAGMWDNPSSRAPGGDG